MAKKKVTSMDVAREAGVSQATVSIISFKINKKMAKIKEKLRINDEKRII